MCKYFLKLISTQQNQNFIIFSNKNPFSLFYFLFLNVKLQLFNTIHKFFEVEFLISIDFYSITI